MNKFKSYNFYNNNFNNKLHEECGVFGVYGHNEAAALTALGLHALQHRGQEAAGIVTFDGSKFLSEKHPGLVGDHFSKTSVIKRLSGRSCVGHNRYSTTGGTSLIEGEQINNNLGLFSNDANHITVNSAESIDLPTTAMSSISDEVTVSFWINGNANVLPQNTTIIEGYDANNYRTLNIHFPWSNGKMYWDCGNSGTTSYDRIDKAASLSEYTDGWSHWAFTKNATTGDLKIYRNGVLWHSGTGHTRTILRCCSLLRSASIFIMGDFVLLNFVPEINLVF